MQTTLVGAVTPCVFSCHRFNLRAGGYVQGHFRLAAHEFEALRGLHEITGVCGQNWGVALVGIVPELNTHSDIFLPYHS